MSGFRAFWLVVVISFVVSAHAHGQALVVLQKCLSANVSQGTLRLIPTPFIMDGKIVRNDWAMQCQGDLAVELWKELWPYRRHVQDWTNQRNHKVQSFWIGNLSNCGRGLFMADGTPAPGNDFWCVIYLDLTDAVMTGLH